MMLLSVIETTAPGSPDFGIGGVLGTAAMGMLIVFTVLILISVFIATLPRILEIVAQVLPEGAERDVPVDPSVSLLPDEAMLAAIGYVLHRELQRETSDSG